jgi:endonuclease-3
MDQNVNGISPDPTLVEKAHRTYEILRDYYGIPEWREPLPPIDELVSTILSQNTNDINRDVAFNRLKEKFPDWEAVRDAVEGEVIDAIRPAGLANQKGPRMQAILRQITEERGMLDLDFLKGKNREEAHQWLSRFNGVGPKTAAIVLQFSLDIPAFPVDTHIYRVTGRIGLRPEKMNVEKTHAWMERLFLPEQFGPGHLNIIQLGREICHPRNPECERCPLNVLCDYYYNLKSTSINHPN